MLKIYYVWQWPVRITHWVNVLSMIMLSITGFYIGSPFMTAPDSSQYVMGWMRFLHFTFAYLFTVSVIARIIWMFIGNHHASWKAFIPWLTNDGRKAFVKMFRYYTFTGKQISYEVGHNPVAATAYLGIFALFLFQIVSGFAMYGQYAPGGFWDSILGGLNLLVGNQWLRLLHHGVMWLLIGFIINHIYSGWLMDIKERNGTMSGIFSGYRYIEPEDL
ncbi:MAG: Ni/Fe-hydrogenase, b-type cytochrome subunit [Deltaproteobacteria bacterium]|jgi:Ni/Fe-hydrogenase 1 B-type cytochrome subunit|nr:Ni/Fe-hydrogenase, b-type cytochrome subunit [Deltaproteobacteria bacterium]MBW2503876.1 Ni/Fe-hydrogenase, b-type cytochrome subunit [Deltaproteobacteria bacterium]MBW2519826.1 Ni/Fe-hydrogenase, b-type cytochrome subunit [Deltaproteobacteria bacterium]